MRLSHHAWLVILGAVTFFTSLSHARSQATNPFKHISTIQSPIIHTPSHRVHASSSFDLTFTLHDTRQRIRLSLVPNHDILAADARITYVDQAGRHVRSEPIVRADHRVFKGSAFVKDYFDDFAFDSDDDDDDDGDGDGGGGGGGWQWQRVGWARIAIKTDKPKPLFEGAFSVFGDHHSVLLKSRYLSTKHQLDPRLDDKLARADDDDDDGEKEYMVVLRNSDIAESTPGLLTRSEEQEQGCNAHLLEFNADSLRHRRRSPNPRWGAISSRSLFGMLSKRSDDVMGDSGSSSGDYQKTIGDTDGCPTTTKVALVGVALDCSYTGSFDSTDDARSNVIHVVNTASQAYEKSLNITLGLQNLTVFPKDCPSSAPKSAPFNLPCDADKDINTRLSLFGQWRGDNADDNAFWTLMSKCGTGNEVGLSWISQLCVNTASGDDHVTGANYIVRNSVEWQVFAHEVGHTFGAVHDCDKTTCKDGTYSKNQCCPLSSKSCDADGKYLMNPSASSKATEFSECTIGNICSAMGSSSLKTSCLRSNRDVPPLTEAQCGNGVVEKGEDCDCGGEDDCKGNTCCNPKTCKFTSGSVCDDANDECCHKCQYASSSTVCRPSIGPCDYEEKCTGKSRECPDDKHHPDGDGCGHGRNCASGQCTSRDDQCRSNMGSALDGNSTRACDDNSCRITCTGPSQNANVCAASQQNFLDGTLCRNAGHCKNGDCETSNSAEIAGWVRRHKGVVIGASCAVAALLAIAAASALFQRRNKPKIPPVPPGAIPPPPPPPGAPGPNGIPPQGQFPPPPYPGPGPGPPNPEFVPTYTRYA